MKRILLITLDFWPNQKGGVATYYAHVCKYLGKAADVHVLTFPLENGNTETNISCKVIRKPLLSRFLCPKWLRAIWEVRNVISQKKIDYVLVGQILPLGTVMWILGYFLKIPYGVFLHGMDLASLKGRKKILAQKILQKSNHVFCNSEFTKSLLSSYSLDERKIHCIFPCPNERLFQKSASSNENKNGFYLLTVARLVKRKGIQYVLESLSLVISEYANIHYTIVGDGPELIELQQITKLLKLEKHVRFLTDISDEELPLLYKQCDLFIMTPIDEGVGDVEGFGIAYLEANAFGKPVIASKTGGVVEAVIHGINGIIVENTQKETIAQSILHLLKNDDIRKDLGERGRLRIINEFSWQYQISVLKDILL